MYHDSRSLINQADFKSGNTRWSLRYKLMRVSWAAVRLFFFRPTPRRIGNRWRLFLLRLFGASIVGLPYISPSCRILDPSKLHVGSGSVIGDNVFVYNYADVSIGSMSVISQGVVLCTGTHDYLSSKMPLTWKGIKVGDLAWVCYEAFIHPGVTIGDGVILGARAVAPKDLVGWSIYSGNPAVFIKKREPFCR